MHIIKAFLFAALIASSSLFAGSPAHAQSAQALPAASLHGEIKYKPGFTHLEYTNPQAPKGGTLKLSATGSFDSLNPYILKGTPAAGLTFLGNNLVFESLMEQSNDEPFTMYGLLAETVEIPEARDWVAFNLNPKAAWADGTPVTASDVVWTFNTLMEKGSPFFKAYYNDVKDVKATSKRRVIFHFGHGGNAELPLIVAQLPVLPEAYWKDKDFAATTLTPPMGSGPYAISTVSPGRAITYAKREDWWGKDLPLYKGRYNFDRISYEYFRDDNVALEAFLAGAFDVRLENTAKLWATAYDAPAVKDGRIIKDEIENGRPAGMQGYIFNLRRPVFAEPKVREAIGLAFDFEWSNKQFAYGAYKRTHSYFENSELASSGLPQGRELEILEKFKDQLPPELFTKKFEVPKTDGSGRNRENLKEAATLLDEAGYTLNKQGLREKDGQVLRFEIIDVNPAFERWSLPFIRNLKRIGIEASFRTVDSAQYQNRMNDFDYDMTVMSIPQSDSPGNEQRDFWASSKADIPGSRNYMGLKDPVVDALIDLIIAAPSREELVARTHALDRVLLWKYMVVPQWYTNTWRLAYWAKLAHPEKLSDMTPGITDTWWVKEQ
ncbi:MAG: extracellular solute-binding protein [Pseudobdellovibrionaceae bacterium]